MPFTGSHPAAVLPLFRLGLLPSALVIGSMAPDLPYYLPIPVHSHPTHSATGIVGIDLLMGLLSFAVWHLLVEPLAVAVAPTGLRRRLPEAQASRSWRWQPGDLRRGLVLVVSLVVGATTHVLWDEFTHLGRFGYRHLPWLADLHGPLAGYRWAQYGSGVFGALVLGWAVLRWWRSAPVTDPPPRPGLPPRTALVVRAGVVLATLGGASAGLIAAVLRDEGLRRALFLIATWGGGAGLVAVLLCALALRPVIMRKVTSAEASLRA
ncbi:MAG TPA: DUF4184 family protein [Kineosporiaceae bacterium]|nr:DUF4184 family protein [Kineosporiaceae bacterium]